jgi:transposase
MVLEQRRLQAISLLDKGFAPVEVSRRVGVNRRSVRRWKAAYRSKGSQALKAKPIPGRPHKLTYRQRKRLERYLLKGPLAAGFSTDLWTCPRITTLIRNEFNVLYHVDHVGRLLHSLGFSPQKPQRRAIERDERAIKNWVRHKWPSIKKKPNT